MAQDGTPKKHGVFGKRVDDWINAMIAKATSGVWKIAESAAGALLSKALLAYYGFK